ncbi:TonB-dependent receptor [Fulvivirga sp. RKSG066]|uniref:SusC/RagA family TonB-linked outer membrane protein n=1 Tax=Fulvivirga aurantia TaxID=2529383 RepID=UPI0012BD1B7C|nr:TonB-dependent receptor [Fulvivirga aurantia]MTI21475.1 TonB-dependent receptor [Fulvivirga aurantia]
MNSKFTKLTGLVIALLMSISSMLVAQEGQIVSGHVDGEDGEPLPGVSIIVKGTSIGTVTDINGDYSLRVDAGATLLFSFIGYELVEVPVNNRATIDIVMEPSVSELSEVVVIGYGTQKKSHLTGAISKVENEKLDQLPVSRVDDALIGQVSGVNIQSTNAEAGGAPTITIRGVGSVTADSGPAVVVDGIVVNSDFLSNLDMNDIASFEVLKDAASAAIYGSEGSNGVILITTKSGKAGPTKFSYQTYLGFKEAHGSDDYRKSVADWVAFEQAQTGELSEETQYMQKIVAITGVDRDWQDVFFERGLIQSHSLSARGGNEQTKFSASLRYLEDEGVVITDEYSLYSARLKLDQKIGDRVMFGLNINPSYSKKRGLPTSIHNPLRLSPWLPIYHSEQTLQLIDRARYPDVGVGDYFWEDHLVELDFNDDGSDTRPRTSGDSNPFQQYVEREHWEYETNLFGSTFLSVDIIKGLTARTSLATTIEQRKRERWDGTNYHAAGASRSQYYLQNRFRTRIISDNTLNYDKNIGRHQFGVLAGVTIQQRTDNISELTGVGYTNDLLKNLEGATLITEPAEINTEYNKVGYFGRLNYVYDGKYLFNASFRRDGSSVFGPNSKYGNFPAVSVGWNVSDEDFLAGSNIISNLKLRVSYGETGSERFSVGNEVVNRWPYLALLDNTNAVINGEVVNGVAPLNIANSVLQWEASQEFNPAVDFGFINNRVTGSLDYYSRTSESLLLENPVSYVTGFTSGIINLGEVRNQGWEFELRSRNVVQGSFKWNTSIIASTNQNELLAFGDSDGALIQDTYGRNSLWINKIGSPISSFYGYVVDTEKYNDAEFRVAYVDKPWNRINGQAEDVIVKDLNGDGRITGDDRTILGDPYPDLLASITNEFSFRDFDLSFMVQGSFGAQVNNIGDQYFYNWFGNSSRSGAAEEAVEDGLIPHESFIQEKVLTSEVIASADYVSLRNVTLGYNMPSSLTSKIGLRGLRVYASGQNLIYKTASDYHGFNPEHIDDDNPRAYGAQRAGTPLFRTYTIGVNVDF